MKVALLNGFLSPEMSKLLIKLSKQLFYFSSLFTNIAYLHFNIIMDLREGEHFADLIYFVNLLFSVQKPKMLQETAQRIGGNELI
jgi:hypothetical protein